MVIFCLPFKCTGNIFLQFVVWFLILYILSFVYRTLKFNIVFCISLLPWIILFVFCLRSHFFPQGHMGILTFFSSKSLKFLLLTFNFNHFGILYVIWRKDFNITSTNCPSITYWIVYCYPIESCHLHYISCSQLYGYLFPEFLLCSTCLFAYLCQCHIF